MRHPEFTVGHFLLNSLEHNPQKTYIVDGSREFSFEDLWQQSGGLARALCEEGLVRGDRVGIFLEKSWESVVSVMAITRAGGVFVNIGSVLKERQVRHIMSNCRIRALITDPARVSGMTLPSVDFSFLTSDSAPAAPWMGQTSSFAQAINSPQPAGIGIVPNERDLATVIYTSGSTGLPKGIMISHHNLVVGAQIVSTYVQNTNEDRLLVALPINLDYGLNQLTTMLRVGGTAVLQKSLLPGDLLRSLKEQRITGMAGMPPIWTIVLQARRNLEREPLETLRYITNSGGMIPHTNLEQLQAAFPGTDIYLMYGLTEAFRATYLPPADIDRGPSCIGRAIPNTDIWIIDQDGNEVAPGETGELIQRGPTVALGYWGAPEKTASVYKPNPLAPAELREYDQVVYSGDVVKKGEDGYFYFVGRRDEMIKTQGYRVSPGEVEDLLTSIPEVYEAVVFGKPDKLMGQKIVALVSLNDGSEITPEQIRSVFTEQAPPYLMPSDIQIRGPLPRTATGKLDRSSLANEYA